MSKETEDIKSSPATVTPIPTPPGLAPLLTQPILTTQVKNEAPASLTIPFQEYPLSDIDALKLIQFLEREDYTDIIQKLLLHHPELQAEFVETCKPRIALKAKNARVSGLFKMVKDTPSKYDHGFVNKTGINQFFREINALRTSNRPADALVKFGYAIYAAISDIDSETEEEMDCLADMFNYFNKEVLDTASVLDPNILTKDDCAKILKTRDLISETDRYFPEFRKTPSRPFRSGIDYLENLLKANELTEPSELEDGDGPASKRPRPDFESSIFANAPFPTPCDDDSNLGPTVLPPLRGAVTSENDSSHPSPSFTLPHINSLPQLPEEVTQLEHQQLQELQRQQQQFYGYPPENQFPAPFP